MVCCQNALERAVFPDFHHFFVSERDGEVPMGTGGSCEMGVGMRDAIADLGVMFVQWGNL